RLASTPTAVSTLAADLAASVATRFLSTPLAPDGKPFPFGAVSIEVDRLATRSHRLLPDPDCALCGELPDDAPPDNAPLFAAPKFAPDSLRGRDLVADLPELTSQYVDPECGVVRELRFVALGTFPTVEAPVGLPGRHRPEGGYGRSFDLRSGEATALAECLERAGGYHPSARRTVVRGSYDELRPDALDPKSLGVYPNDRYADPEFRFQRYADDLELAWVWGYSFRREQPVLVPQSVAYYGTTQAQHGRDQPFVHEVSNGCAIGSSLSEAVLHGLLEVAERDGFLLTWFTRLPVRRLDPTTVPGHVLPLMLERLRYATGYGVEVFDTTMEQGVPAFWAMARDLSGQSDRPATISTGAAHLNPVRAVINAVHELAPMIDALPGSYRDRRPLVERMVDDPELVVEMSHHVLLYGHPATLPRFSFLFQRPMEPYQDLAGSWSWPTFHDIADDARHLVERYLDSGLDVVVVDQTGSEQQAGGFRCVKVLVPGTIPMTFGHRFRRVDGLPRLLSVPALLGYRADPLDPADLNPDPHPFP
ncbi:MAG: biosynthesis cyclodehydratase, partial [Marmoricola sp.]|nr:biosynthesis cyclodehydratase [Marmoricola sp.]